MLSLAAELRGSGINLNVLNLGGGIVDTVHYGLEPADANFLGKPRLEPVRRRALKELAEASSVASTTRTALC